MIQRHLTTNLITALKDTPVVVLHGARQTGKSTLVRELARSGHPGRYITLDDAVALSAPRDRTPFAGPAPRLVRLLHHHHSGTRCPRPRQRGIAGLAAAAAFAGGRAHRHAAEFRRALTFGSHAAEYPQTLLRAL